MEKTNLQLYKASDAEEAYAIRLQGEQSWVVRNGFGSQFEPVWTIEVQSESPLQRGKVDWEIVLDRVVEAYRLSDPVLTAFQWPVSRNQ